MPLIAQSASSKTIRLLLVDDRSPEFEQCVARLQENGGARYRTEWAGTFNDGIAALRRGECDVAIFNDSLGGRNGAHLLPEAASSSTAPPVILLSDSPEADIDEAAAALGVTDCLCKASLDAVRLECSIRYAMRHAQVLSALKKTRNQVRIETEIVRKSQGRLLAAITDNLPIMVGRLDDKGRVIEAEGKGLAARGMAPERLLQQPFARLYPETGEAIEQAIAGMAASCAIQGHDQEEEWHVEFFVFPDADRVGAAVFFGRDVTVRKNLESKLLSISDAEQRRIGADLHDGLGQHLTGTACIAAALCEKLKSSRSPHAAKAANIVALINAAIDMTRGLARGLCPVQVEKGGLCSALEDFSYQVQRLHGVTCHFHPIGPPRNFEPHIALHLYRIVQEAINNVLRHSSATEITITLDRTFLAIEDNGGGFDPAALADSRRLGLRLMHYRAAMVGGSLKINRRKEGGMRVECSFSRPFS